MPFGLDKYYGRFFDDDDLLGSREDRYNLGYDSGYSAGYNDGQNAGLKEGLRTGEINGAFDEARRIALKLKELNILTQEQISEITGIKPERMI